MGEFEEMGINGGMVKNGWSHGDSVAMENHNFQWENSLKKAMFNGYVSLPKGTLW